MEINHLKNNDAYFHQFLHSIRNNKGVLILGTSESTSLDGINYWAWLNADPDLTTQFSTFSGAGRFAEVYFPLIASSPEAWRGLEVLVFVNPTYWRLGLSRRNTKSNKTYLNRYLSPEVVVGAQLQLEALQLYAPFFEAEFGGHPILRTKYALDQWVDQEWRSMFYRQLRSQWRTPKWDYSNLTSDKSLIERGDATFLDSLKQLIDPEFNCSPAYVALTQGAPKMPALDTVSTFRMQALEGMIQLSREYGIQTTFLLGPYNGTLAKAGGSPELQRDYEHLMQELRTLFESHQQPYIDLGHLSHENHTFRDVQHHSHYGGYRIYQEIKRYYENR